MSAGKFDAALIILRGIVDHPGTDRLTIYEDFKADKLDEFKAAISVLEAAGKVDKAKSIIARLRAADALCAAAKDAKHELTFAPCRDNPERTSCLKCGTTEALRKAIAEYEEG